MSQARAFPSNQLKDLKNAIRTTKDRLATQTKRLMWYRSTKYCRMHALHNRNRNEHYLIIISPIWQRNCCKTVLMTYPNNGRCRTPNATIERKISQTPQTNSALPISKTKTKRATFSEIMVRSWRHIKCELVKLVQNFQHLKCIKKKELSHRLTAASASVTKVTHSSVKGPLRSLSHLFAQFFEIKFLSLSLFFVTFS